MKKSETQNNFLLGAFILCFSNIAVKIIGAIYKIPLSNLLGKEGLGIFYVAYNIYTALFVLSTAGLPVAVSKLVSEAVAHGQIGTAKKIFKVSLAAFSVIGGVVAVALIVFARGFTQFIGNSMAYFAVIAIAPSLLFTAVISTVRGYYQGLSDMTPTAVSQVIEAVIKLILGFFAAYILLENGFPIEIAVAGAVCGVTVGTLFSACYLIIKYMRGTDEKLYNNNLCVTKNAEILKSILKIAVPITVGASVSSVSNIIDVAVVMRRMQHVGFSEAAANAMYGAYNMAVTVFNLPQTLIAAVGISIMPVIAGNYAKNRHCEAYECTASALRIALFAALPCAAGMMVLAEPITKLIYFGKAADAGLAAPMLSVLSVGVVFISIVSVSNSALQAAGRVSAPIISMLIGAAVKISANYMLVGNGRFNITGAALATVLCYGITAMLNIIYMYASGFCLEIFKPIISFTIASAGMGAFSFVANFYLSCIIGEKASVCITIIAAVPVYLALVLIIGGFEKRDLLLIPHGEKLAKILNI